MQGELKVAGLGVDGREVLHPWVDVLQDVGRADEGMDRTVDSLGEFAEIDDKSPFVFSRWYEEAVGTSVRGVADLLDDALLFQDVQVVEALRFDVNRVTASTRLTVRRLVIFFKLQFQWGSPDGLQVVF